MQVLNGCNQVLPILPCTLTTFSSPSASKCPPSSLTHLSPQRSVSSLVLLLRARETRSTSVAERLRLTLSPEYELRCPRLPATSSDSPRLADQDRFSSGLDLQSLARPIAGSRPALHNQTQCWSVFSFDEKTRKGIVADEDGRTEQFQEILQHRPGIIARLVDDGH